jgi:diguanylate cyclase (GGDEF)-like protein/PAS domain S-box-containing protein
MAFANLEHPRPCKQPLVESLPAEIEYHELFENASDLVYSHDLNGVLLAVNKAFERLTGTPREEALGRNISEWIDPESVHLLHEMVRRKLGGMPRTVFEVTLNGHEGRRISLEVGARLVFRDGAPVGVQGIARDITARKKAEILERGRNRVLEMVAGNEALPGVLKELCGMVERQVHQAVCSVLLAEERGLVCVAGPSPSGEPTADAALLAGDGGYQVPIEAGDGRLLGVFLLTGEGFQHPGADDLRALEAARRLAVVAIEHQQLTERLAHQALHDALTKLPNRHQMECRLAEILALAQRNNWLLAVLFIDLDRFKQINDTLGHAAGDQVLRQVARRLEGCLRKSDCLARMGGDEFTVVLPELADSRDAQRVAQKLLAALQAPFEVDGQELFLSASIGISLYPRDGNDPAVLQRKADTAMYRAKSHGRNGFEFFTQELGLAALERLAIENALRRAVDNQELLLYYQPQFDAQGGLAGFETLLAWCHPALGLTSPARFIPVAEDSGMIVPIGAWVLAKACRQCAEWQRAGGPRVRVAVNVSASQFKRTDFIETVASALTASGLDPALLELELTEGVVVSGMQEATRQMERLRALGVGISIDDFGTGYSSLSYLRQLPVDALKTDRSFLREMDREPAAIPLLKAIASLAHGLRLTVVAEGVESQSQMDVLRSVGCDLFQGYFLGGPVPAAEAARLVLGAPPTT